MAASIAQTLYTVGENKVDIIVVITVQGNATALTVTASEPNLLALAVADGRTDWTTVDCATYASAEIGMTVT